MEVLTYKTCNTDKLLDEDVVIANLIETDKISNPQYIMSAGTAWLRRHPGKTLYDLQVKLCELGLTTIILAEEPKSRTEYTLCLPGNRMMEAQLVYEAKFVSSPILAARSQIHIDRLKYTGYSCSLEYKHPPKPDIKKIQKPGTDVQLQLQWAAVKFTVEYVVVNPDEELRKDLDKLNPNSYQEREFDTKDERIHVYIDTKTNKCVSEFGRIVRPSGDGKAESKLVVHLPTYLNA